jgi:hypothetical protein
VQQENPQVQGLIIATGPWQAPINVSNEKSGILPKFIHFSRPFIHVSRVGSALFQIFHTFLMGNIFFRCEESQSPPFFVVIHFS